MSAVDLNEMQPAAAKVRLPFGFAKRFGVLLQAQADGWLLVVNPQTPPTALLEVRRLLSAPFKVQKLQQTEFDALLEASYQRDSIRSSTNHAGYWQRGGFSLTGR